MKKEFLPIKTCYVCKKKFMWRKKWKNVWSLVKYCSKKCSKSSILL
ncbi:MAG: hypothetical protein CMM95_00380 [Rickettsiales bacterium]|nr:hypothetical protein [Rickettsiales bacterium]